MTERNGSTRAWRDLRARAIRREIRRHGAVYCSTCGRGPLDPRATPGSRDAIDADHVHPVALGGRVVPTIEDVRLRCVRCNRGEGRAIAAEKARRDRETEHRQVNGPAAGPGYLDENNRWNTLTRAW